MFKKLWNDPVWSKVIAAAIIATCASAAAYFLHWWPAIGRRLLQCWTFLFASTATPNWVLIILGLFALPVLVVIGFLVWDRLFPTQTATRTWRSYTSDQFFGLRWRWKYFDDGEIYDAHTFCPHCDFQVYPMDVSRYRINPHIAFHCESCGTQLGDFQEPFDSLESKTKRFIQQKIRNNQWRSSGST